MISQATTSARRSTSAASPEATEEPCRIKLHGGQWEPWKSGARIVVVVAGRRWGKSELAVWKTIERCKKLTAQGVTGVAWYILPTYRVARPIWRKFLTHIPPGWLTEKKGTEKQPDFMRIGSIVVEFKSAEKPESLVAEGLQFLIMDECADIHEDAWKEVRPTLMDYSAPALLVGSPGPKNWFYGFWLRGQDPEYPRVESYGGPSFENPFLRAGELEEIMEDMSERDIEREILAIFLDDEGEVFRAIKTSVDRALQLYPSNEGYCDHPTRFIGVDLARKKDFTVLYGMCAQGHGTGFQRFREVRWGKQKRIIRNAWEDTGREALVVLDAAGIGDVVFTDLEDAGVRVIPVQTGANKVQIVDALDVTLETGEVTIPNEKVLVNELKAYTYSHTARGNISYHAPEGGHDDCVIAACLAAWALKNAPPAARLWGGAS